MEVAVARITDGESDRLQKDAGDCVQAAKLLFQSLEDANNG